MPAWVQPVAEQLWSFIAVAMAVNALGTVSKRIAEHLGWRRYRQRDVRAVIASAKEAATGGPYRDPAEASGDFVLPSDASWYDITLRLHPLVVGALFGFLPLPTLNVIDGIAKDPEAGASALLAARCAWFMLAGALSGQIYEAVKFAFGEGRARILALFGRSPPPPPPPTITNLDPAPALAEELEPEGDATTGNEKR
jgi:hypothetical protein